jgi:predicted small lipoprotein YifL
MRTFFSLLLALAVSTMMVGCGSSEPETPPPGVDTAVPDLEIDTGDIVPADEIEAPSGGEEAADDAAEPAGEESSDN